MKIITILGLLCLALYSCGPTHVVYTDSPNNYSQAPAQTPAPAPSPAPDPTPAYQPAPPPPIDFQTFYDQLSPYGTWIQSPNYGYVWAPNAGPDFTPYSTAGNWQYSPDYGWIWSSAYPWGWAPFHYGRWFYDEMYGWMWVPGYQWAPAWVVWGSYQNYSGNYYGWAPMGPGVAYSSAGYYPPSNYWTFVPANHVCEQNVYNYRQQNFTVVNNNVTIINNSNTYNNQSYYAGPRATEVEQATGKPITPVVVREATNPGTTSVQNKQLTIYRPAVITTNTTKATPAQVVPRENLQPVTRQPANPPKTNPQTPEPKPTPAQNPIIHPQPAPPPVQKNNNQPVQPVQQPAKPVVPVQQPSKPVAPVQQPTKPLAPVQQPIKPAPSNPQSAPVNPNQKPVKRPATKPVKPTKPLPAPTGAPQKEEKH